MLGRNGLKTAAWLPLQSPTPLGPRCQTREDARCTLIHEGGYKPSVPPPHTPGSLRGEGELQFYWRLCRGYKSGTDDNCPGAVRTRVLDLSAYLQPPLTSPRWLIDP